MQRILLILAVMIVIVAGIGIMVSMYNSMSDRRHEIAIIRALGARRTTIMVVVLLIRPEGLFGVAFEEER